MDVHLRDLRYAVAVADELNVTAAAQRLFVAQPTISKQLRALERQVGFPLFVRHPAGVTLTPAGAVFIDRARVLLEEWSASVAVAKAVAVPRVLRIGLQTAVGRGIVGDLTGRLDASQWQVSVRVVPWTDPSAGLADGSSDIAILWHPIPESVQPVRVLREERRSVVVHADHPIAGEDSVSFDRIRDEPVIALPESAGRLRDFWIAADARDVAPAAVIEATTADETFEAVSAGLGIAIVAHGNADLYRRPNVVTIPIRDLEPARLVLCTARTPTPQAQALLRSLGTSP